MEGSGRVMLVNISVPKKCRVPSLAVIIRQHVFVNLSVKIKVDLSGIHHMSFPALSEGNWLLLVQNKQ